MTLILDPRAAPFIDLVDFEDLPEHRANALPFVRWQIAFQERGNLDNTAPESRRQLASRFDQAPDSLQDMVANAKAEKRRSASLRAGPYVFLKPMLGRFRNMHTVI